MCQPAFSSLPTGAFSLSWAPTRCQDNLRVGRDGVRSGERGWAGVCAMNDKGWRQMD